MAVAAFLLLLEASDPSEAGWWRLAFILALPLGLVGVVVRRRVSETSQFLAVKQAGQVIRRPIPRLWATERPALLRGFALIAAGSVAFNTFFIFMPNHLAVTTGLSLASMLALSAAALLVVAATAVGLGRLSDVIGRRPVAIWSTAALIALAAPASVFASTSQLGLLLAQLAIGGAIAGCCWSRWSVSCSQRHSDRLGCR